jgi:hypothetical protein
MTCVCRERDTSSAYGSDALQKRRHPPKATPCRRALVPRQRSADLVRRSSENRVVEALPTTSTYLRRNSLKSCEVFHGIATTFEVAATHSSGASGGQLNVSFGSIASSLAIARDISSPPRSGPELILWRRPHIVGTLLNTECWCSNRTPVFSNLVLIAQVLH